MDWKIEIRMQGRWMRDGDKDLLQGLCCKESYAPMLRILHVGFMFEWMDFVVGGWRICLEREYAERCPKQVVDILPLVFINI